MAEDPPDWTLARVWERPMAHRCHRPEHDQIPCDRCYVKIWWRGQIWRISHLDACRARERMRKKDL